MQVWSKHECNLYNRLMNESIDNHRSGFDGFGKKLPERPVVGIFKETPLNLKGTTPTIVLSEPKYIEDVMDKASRLPDDTTHEKLLETIMELKDLEQISLFDQMQQATLVQIHRKTFDVKPLIEELTARTENTC